MFLIVTAKVVHYKKIATSQISLISLQPHVCANNKLEKTNTLAEKTKQKHLMIVFTERNFNYGYLQSKRSKTA